MRKKYSYSIETEQPNTDLPAQSTESSESYDNTKTTENSVLQKSTAVCKFCGNPINKNLPNCKYCGTETYKSLKTYNNSKKIKLNNEQVADSFRARITPSFIIDTVFDIHNHNDLTERQINRLGSSESIILKIAAFLFPHLFLAYYNKYFNLCLACIFPIIAFALPHHLFWDIVSLFFVAAPSVLAGRLFPKRVQHTSFNYKAEPVFITKKTLSSCKHENSNSIFKDLDDPEKRPPEYYDLEKFIIPLKVKKFFNDISDKPRKRNTKLAIAMIPIYIFSIILLIIKVISSIKLIAITLVLFLCTWLDYLFPIRHRKYWHNEY